MGRGRNCAQWGRVKQRFLGTISRHCWYALLLICVWAILQPALLSHARDVHTRNQANSYENSCDNISTVNMPINVMSSITHAGEWESLGGELHIPWNRIEVIDIDRYTVGHKRLVVLRVWYEDREEAHWEEIVESLKRKEQRCLANRIDAYIKKSVGGDKYYASDDCTSMYSSGLLVNKSQKEDVPRVQTKESKTPWLVLDQQVTKDHLMRNGQPQNRWNDLLQKVDVCSFALFFLRILLLLGGDIERNPGPESILTMDDLPVLMKKLTGIAGKRCLLAVQLNFPPETLDGFPTDIQPYPIQALQELLTCWLKRTNPPPSLEALAEVVGGPVIGNGLLARTLLDKRADFPSIQSREAAMVNIVATPRTRIALGQSVTLTCNVTKANPTVFTYEWTFVGTGTTLSETSETLTLSNIMASQFGDYTCDVTNAAGTGSDTITIVEGELPDVTVEPQNDPVVLGDTITLMCSATGDTPITYEWELVGNEGNVLSSNPDFTLTLGDGSNYGTYRCTATNILGNDSGTVEVVQATQQQSSSGSGEEYYDCISDQPSANASSLNRSPHLPGPVQQLSETSQANQASMTSRSHRRVSSSSSRYESSTTSDGCSQRRSISPPAGFPFLDTRHLNKYDRSMLKEKLNNDAEDMKHEFVSLGNITLSSLKCQGKTTKQLALCVLQHQGFVCKHEKKIWKAKCVEDIFYILYKKQCWSFLNYNILKHVIDDLGTDDDKRSLDKYLSKFKEFCNRSVFEVPDHVYGTNATLPRFAVKIRKNESKLEKVLNNSRSNIAKALGMTAVHLHLCCVEDGCIKVHFVVPEYYITKEELLPPSPEQLAALAKISIQFLEYKGKQYICQEHDGQRSRTPESAITTNSPEQIFKESHHRSMIRHQWAARTLRRYWLCLPEENIQKFHYNVTKRGSTIPELPLIIVHVPQAEMAVCELNVCDTTMLDACMKGDRMSALFWLTPNVYIDLEEKSQDGETTFLHACKSGMLDLAMTLVERGADISVLDANGRCCVHFIEILKNQEFAEILIKSDNFCTPLMVGHSVEQECKILLQNICRASPDGVPRALCRPLVEACTHGHIKLAHLLLDNGANPNVADERGKIPLFAAVESNAPEIAQMLIEKGADVNLTQDNFYTPLMVGCTIGDSVEQVCEILLQNRASPDGDPRALCRPLVEACARGHIKLAHLLLDNGAKPNVTDERGRIPLCTAVESNAPEIAQKLIEKGAHVNAFQVNHNSPLMVGCTIGESVEQVCEILLQNGASPDGDPRAHCRPLVVACARGHIKLVQLLLTNKADPNITDQRGKTPLFAALQFNRPEIVQKLMRMGGDVIATWGLCQPFIKANAHRHRIRQVLHLLKTNSLHRSMNWHLRAASYLHEIRQYQGTVTNGLQDQRTGPKTGTDLVDSRIDLQDQGSGLQDQGTGLQDPGAYLQNRGTGLQDPRKDLQDPGTGLQDPGTGLQDRGTDLQDQGTGLQDRGTDLQDPGTGLQDPRKDHDNQEMALGQFRKMTYRLLKSLKEDDSKMKDTYLESFFVKDIESYESPIAIADVGNEQEKNPTTSESLLLWMAFNNVSNGDDNTQSTTDTQLLKVLFTEKNARLIQNIKAAIIYILRPADFGQYYDGNNSKTKVLKRTPSPIVFDRELASIILETINKLISDTILHPSYDVIDYVTVLDKNQVNRLRRFLIEIDGFHDSLKVLESLIDDVLSKTANLRDPFTKLEKSSANYIIKVKYTWRLFAGETWTGLLLSKLKEDLMKLEKSSAVV